MKNITRALALLLALVLILGLVVTGFADGAGASPATTGTITINSAVKDQTYKIYRILELESFDETAKAYSYKVATKWKNFIDSETGKQYFSVQNNRNDNIEDGYVSWVGEQSAERVAAFAKIALKYATDNSIEADGTHIATSASVSFNTLPLGYYLLDSSLGTLCSLSTTKPEATITEKNDVPTNKKEVKEGNNWATSNDANIGDTVEFQSTITAKLGADSYVFHDTMSEGLTFNSTSVKVTKGENAENVDATNYTLKAKNDGTSTFTDDCTFEIVFDQKFCDSLKKDDTIVITYSATLNENAVIGSDGTTSNTNKSKLSYGDNSATTWDSTTTKTWKVSVFKFHQKDGTTKTPLSGAKFTLNRKNDGTEAINLVPLTGVGNENTYRVANADETATAITEITTDTTGKFTIQGLDSDTYYLTEKEAPKGYNKLKDPIKIVIDENGNVKVNNATTPVTEVGVENKTGAEMPSTGGIGTTVFYVVGGILAVGAAVLLVTKKRMERG